MGSMMGMVNGFAIYDLYGTDLSSFQDHYRKKCPVYFNGKNPGLYKWRDQQAIYYVHVFGGGVLSAFESAAGNSNHESSVSGDDAVQYFRMDHALDDPMIYVQMFAAGIITYGIVALLEFRRVKKVPMDEALKNVE